MNRNLFVELVKEHREGLWRFVCALCCGDAARADDLAQDTCVKAYVAMDSLTDDTKFKSWLFRTAYNTFLDSCRQHRNSDVLAAAESMVAADSADRSFRYEALYSALARLSEKERAATVLFYIQGYQVKEIAAIVSSNESAIKKQLSRARDHLKILLNDEYGD